MRRYGEGLFLIALLSCMLAICVSDIPDDYNFGDIKIIDEDENYVYEDPSVIEDKLADKYGQCPIPSICFTNFKGCDLNITDVTIVNCTHRSAGPYVPIFRYYAISARTWDFDFSNNYIQTLDHTSFYTSDPINPIPINMTRLDLSYNFIHSIASDTFRGNVTKQMTYLDLSHNSLTKLEEGVFSDVPVLEMLDLSYNQLYSIDSMCMMQLPRVQVLNVEYNRISYLLGSCFSTSRLKSSGELILRNNAIGSINDCSYTGIKTVTIDNNPVICGCSNTLTSIPCWKRNSDDTFEKSTEGACYKSPSTCSDVAFNLSYNLHGADDYKITVQLSSDTTYDATLYEYKNLELSPEDPESGDAEADESETADLKIHVLRTVTNSANFTDAQHLSLDRNNVYSVCVNRYGQSYQTRCSLLAPPRAPSASGATTLSTGGLALFVHLGVFAVAALWVPAVIYPL